jgi:hypothetical protein
VHDDHRDADQAAERPDDVVAVGAGPVGDHAPGQAAGDQHAVVRGQDPADVGVGLRGRDEAVRARAIRDRVIAYWLVVGRVGLEPTTQGS